MTREQMIDQAVRRVAGGMWWPTWDIEMHLSAGCSACKQHIDRIRAEFRGIALDQRTTERNWNALCDAMQQRYAHTYEVKH